MKSLQRCMKQIVPPLTSILHKGQLGKICVIGGCKEYTGAPYYAGISAQRVGADLVSIICAEEAGIPIKCYSPELIVYPIIQLIDCDVNSDPFMQSCQANIARVIELLPRFDSIVIGPGAGRHPVMVETLSKVISFLIQDKKPLVIDGDGLWVVTQNVTLLKEAENVILTPNQMEFSRLWNRVMNEQKTPSDLNGKKSTEYASRLAQQMKGITILQKGEVDIIAFDTEIEINNEQGSLRRCGGLGDIVAGVMGVMNLWSIQENRKSPLDYSPGMIAAMMTSTVVRKAGAQSFAGVGRGMTAASLLHYLPSIVDSL